MTLQRRLKWKELIFASYEVVYEPGLQTADLPQRATSKGLVAGASLLMSLHSGEDVQCKDSEVSRSIEDGCITHSLFQGTIIPSGEDIASFSIKEDIFWVLLVEKDVNHQAVAPILAS